MFLPFFEGCEETLTTAAATTTFRNVSIDLTCLPTAWTPALLGSDIAAAQSRVGYGQYMVDGTPADEGGYQYHPGLTIGGVAYEKGIFAHAASAVTFNNLQPWATVSACRTSRLCWWFMLHMDK